MTEFFWAGFTVDTGVPHAGFHSNRYAFLIFSSILLAKNISVHITPDPIPRYRAEG